MTNLHAVKIICLALLLYLSPSQLLGAETQPAFVPTAQLHRQAVITVGGDQAYPPYEFINADGNPDGYIVELTQAIAEIMGFKVVFELGEWSEARRRLQTGQVDILEGVAYLN